MVTLRKQHLHLMNSRASASEECVISEHCCHQIAGQYQITDPNSHTYQAKGGCCLGLLSPVSAKDSEDIRLPGLGAYSGRVLT